MDHLGRTLEILEHLVAFDTTSAGSNLDLIDYVAQMLSDAHIGFSRVYDEYRTKAGLIATIGPNVPGGIVLSGHTDVVPVAGQNWLGNPFTLRHDNGRLFGRGTADMKGFLAAVLACLPLFEQGALKIPIYLAFSYDEEIGCLGAPPLIKHLVDSVPLPSIVIVGEPTQMKVANRHRGLNAYLTTVQGRDGHSSAPENGVNAIAVAAQCIKRLTDRAAAGFLTSGSHSADHSDERPTLNIGTISGGTALNIIAARCQFAWECRSAAEDASQVLLEDLDQFHQEVSPDYRVRAPDFSIETENTIFVPPLRPNPEATAEHLALMLTGQNRCISAPFATEAGHFSAAGLDTVVCGPGSVAQAHQPDEFVTMAQLEACISFLHRLASWMQKSHSEKI
ncbi:MAG: acetylornithine deacetylase [Hyphomicrobiales bacterium]|nr:acetylornithine deacetylase [Hyphomicrobiales bacterium]